MSKSTWRSGKVAGILGGVLTMASFGFASWHIIHEFISPESGIFRRKEEPEEVVEEEHEEQEEAQEQEKPQQTAAPAVPAVVSPPAPTEEKIFAVQQGKAVLLQLDTTEEYEQINNDNAIKDE